MTSGPVESGNMDKLCPKFSVNITTRSFEQYFL